MNSIETLNKLLPGWSEVSSNGLLCNPSVYGGIIDIAPAIGEWFVIFHDSRQTISGLETRDDAIEAFASSQIKHYKAR